MQTKQFQAVTIWLLTIVCMNHSVGRVYGAEAQTDSNTLLKTIDLAHDHVIEGVIPYTWVPEGAIPYTGEILFVPGFDERFVRFYLYRRSDNSQWKEVGVLAPKNSIEPIDLAMDNSGDTLLVGAPGSEDSGIVIQFKRRESGLWEETTPLVPSVDATSEQERDFGRTIAISGDKLAVAGGDCVYVFRRDQGDAWKQTARLTNDSNDSYNFGCAAALDGDTLVVGASHPDQRFIIYVFRSCASGDWNKTAVIKPMSANPFEHITSIAVGQNIVVTGSASANSETGRVYVFDQVKDGTWKEAAVLTAPDGVAGDRFGSMVALSGKRLIVGGQNHVEERGACYVFEPANNATWKLAASATGQGNTETAGNGISAAIVEDSALITAWRPNRWIADGAKGVHPLLEDVAARVLKLIPKTPDDAIPVLADRPSLSGHPWANNWRFQISRSQNVLGKFAVLHVRCAGPDKQFETGDDFKLTRTNWVEPTVVKIDLDPQLIGKWYHSGNDTEFELARDGTVNYKPSGEGRGEWQAVSVNGKKMVLFTYISPNGDTVWMPARLPLEHRKNVVEFQRINWPIEPPSEANWMSIEVPRPIYIKANDDGGVDPEDVLFAKKLQEQKE